MGILSRSTLALLLVACNSAARAGDNESVTPYRPTVSTPAQLPRPGQLEFEFGVLGANNPDGRRNTLPYTFKLAFDQDWGVLLEGDAYVAGPTGDGRERSFGDTGLVLKRAFIVDNATAYGLELTARLPTARDALGSGKTDWTINTIWSQDLGALHVDLNLNGTRLGRPPSGASWLLMGASAAFSRKIDKAWGATWELSGTRNRGSPSSAQLLAAVTYAPDRNLVIDAGFARGLTPGSPRWSFFTGFVVPLARYW
ncbi:transporter [Massilia horti]|uniref:Transporter n=1 Tax=Massilia horti TaxID=2562153 RepID=A0A4Y9T969_9BURK|nr:transporter [Massilia horti]TFW34658.1 transporter [Massilia horti]